MKSTGLAFLILIFTVPAFANGLINASFAAVDAYCNDQGLARDQASDKLFGFATERHAQAARVRMYDVTTSLIERPYGCSVDGASASCWKQTSLIPRAYQKTSAARTVSDLKNSVEQVAKLMAARGADPESFSLLKIWPSQKEVRVRLGYEHNAIEETYICASSASGMACRLADSFSDDEP